DFFLSRKKSTANIAKERLQIIVAERRRGDSEPAYLPDMKRDLLGVICKYVPQETDWYMEHDNTEFSAPTISLCVRRMLPAGINLLIVKGPDLAQCEAVRIEDAEKTVSMFTTLGYHCILNYTKSREIYFLDEFHITIDKLDKLGSFAEFAIMTDDQNKLSLYADQLKHLAIKFGFTEKDLEKNN
ncbi:cell division topological specificity factor MinE, partial [Staphylococcus aureus]|nr:cell division topological specificity factor MinE [Staphylococcus aureus]